MLNKLRSAVYSAVGGQEDSVPAGPRPPTDPRPPKFPYSRPAFLRLASEDEAQVAGDRSIRPIMVPRDIACMPWMSGYAEAVNAGKSKRNEDNAHIHVGTLQRSEEDAAGRSVQYYYFGVFDGHAGHGASTAAANQLHHIVHEKLSDVIDYLLPASGVPEPAARTDFFWVPREELSVDKLVTGALEAAFNDMDALIAEDRRQYEMRGGCTALVALFLLGRLYVANAGDSRAVLCRRGRSLVASHDFTPETERQRVRQLASRQPALCGSEFTHLEFCRRLTRRDLGKRVLYRDAHMTGWAYKTVTEHDVKFPVVCGEGKRSRVCATIGVTRGFGDHGLRAHNTGVFVKPFLLSQPEVLIINLEEESVTESDVLPQVLIINLEEESVTESDVLVMATDGLWDVISNEKMAELVERALKHFPAEDETLRRYRCISAAQELVMAARGKMRDSRQWRRGDGSPATVDDISVFVIPLLAYREEHLLWKAENAVPTPPPSTPTTNGVRPEPPAADWAPTVSGEPEQELDTGQWGSPASEAALNSGTDTDPAPAALDGGLVTAGLDAGDGGPQERVRCGQGVGAGRPRGLAGSPAPAADGVMDAVSEKTECSPAAVGPAPSVGGSVIPAVSPVVPAASTTVARAVPGPVAPVPSTPVVPAPSGPVMPISSTPVAPPPSTPVAPPPSTPVAPSPSGPVVPAPSGPVAPAPSGPVAPSPSGPVVPAPSGPVAPPPSTPVAPPPSGPVVPPPSGPVVPPPSGPVAPHLPSPVVPPPSGPVVPPPSGPVVPHLPSPVVPPPSGPVVPPPSGPVTSHLPSPVAPPTSGPAAPSPSTPGAPSPSTPVAPSPSTPVAPSPSTPVAPSPSTPVAPSPSTPVVPSNSVPDRAAAPLVVGQAVPPTLVQTVPRSSVQLLPPAPAPAQDPPPADPQR